MKPIVLFRRIEKLSGQLKALFLLIAILTALLPEITSHAEPSFSQPGNWVSLTVPQAPGGDVISLALTPSDSKVLYSLIRADQGDRFFRSLDGGLTWQERNHFSVDSQHSYDNLIVDPANSLTVYANGASGLQRSLDGGDTWKNIYFQGEVFTAVSSDILYSGGGTGSCGTGSEKYYNLARSDDGGGNWYSSPLGCLYQLEQVAVLPSEPNIIYLSVYKPGASEGTMLKSNDGGLTWNAYTLPFEGAKAALLIDPVDSHRLYASGIYGILRSTNSGETWQQISDKTMGTYHRLKLSGGSLYAIEATTGKAPVYRSDDGGVSWWVSMNFIQAGASILMADSTQAGRLWAGLVGYGIYSTENGGSSWIARNSGIQTATRISELAVSDINRDVMYAAVDNPYPGIYRTTDGGKTWTAPLSGFGDVDTVPLQFARHFFPITPEATSAWYPPLQIYKLLVHPQHPEIAWAATSNGIYDTDDGINWTLQLSMVTAVDLAVSPLAPDEPYAAGYDSENYPYVAKRSCTFQPWNCHWQSNRITSGPLTINSVWVDPYNQQHLIISGAMYIPTGKGIGIFESLTGGISWEQTGQIDMNEALAALAIDPQNCHIMTAVLVDYWNKTGWIFRSLDGGTTWQDWSQGAPLFGFEWHLVMDELGSAYYGTTAGVYRRQYSQNAWETLGLPDSEIHALVYQIGPAPFLFAAAYSGLWRLDFPPIQRTWLPSVGR